ncbi:YopX family protein [Anaerovorax sp. IOR16]|uniref:YopX family protein n=1 Tax=Anaerovorax sp. IOR16 TaxID=2773458 RepID=UPI0019D28E4C|nr:YopX family protein [Anaerovorax sp. IOR16]
MRENEFRGKHIHAINVNKHLNGTWVYGYLSADNYINSSVYIGEIMVAPETVGRYTCKCDISGQEVFEGDIIESHIGGQVLANNLVIRYGVYQAYCPIDKCFMDSVGFYASGRNLPDMPIGRLEEYAKVIGNIIDNPELVNW